ncbi:MAG: hypothetical protein ACP5MD_03070 [Verrucomicrobiia bacterium]
MFNGAAFNRAALTNVRRHRVFARQATLVPATPGWEICGLTAIGFPWDAWMLGARHIRGAG